MIRSVFVQHSIFRSFSCNSRWAVCSSLMDASEPMDPTFVICFMYFTSPSVHHLRHENSKLVWVSLHLHVI